MTILLVIFAIGFIISIIVIASVMADMTESERSKNAHRNEPQEEQHLDPGNRASESTRIRRR